MVLITHDEIFYVKEYQKDKYCEAETFMHKFCTAKYLIIKKDRDIESSNRLYHDIQ